MFALKRAPPLRRVAAHWWRRQQRERPCCQRRWRQQRSPARRAASPRPRPAARAPRACGSAGCRSAPGRCRWRRCAFRVCRRRGGWPGAHAWWERTEGLRRKDGRTDRRDRTTEREKHSVAHALTCTSKNSPTPGFDESAGTICRMCTDGLWWMWCGAVCRSIRACVQTAVSSVARTVCARQAQHRDRALSPTCPLSASAHRRGAQTERTTEVMRSESTAVLWLSPKLRRVT